MLELRFSHDAGRSPVALVEASLVLGSDAQCGIVLADESMAPRHAEIQRSDDGWWIADLGGGVALDGVAVLRARLHPGDRLRLGTVELTIHGEDVERLRPRELELTAAEAVRAEETQHRDARFERKQAEDKEAGNSKSGDVTGGGAPQFPARLRDPTSAVVLDPELPLKHATLIREIDPIQGKRRLLDEAYDNEIFRRLLDLASALVRSTSVEDVGRQVLAAVFEAFPSDRGFFFLEDGEGELVCEVARLGDSVESLPEGDLPVSSTLLRTVMERRVAVVTGDARLDERLEGGRSLILHDIRSALCAPLLSGSSSQILGVLQLDTPSVAGVFRDRDLDLLTAVADLAAGAVDRIRLARLGRYHSPAVVEEVLRRREAAGRGLREADVTVLFADLVGFTAFAESAEPEAVVAMLRGFFDRAVEAVFAEGGTLDKFLGDGVLAFFGAPVPQPDHPRRAVEAAKRLQVAMGAWTRQGRQADLPALDVRVALESGPVLVGEIGSEPRMEYTVLGATVNRAARLEQSVAGAGEVVLGPEIRQRLGADFPVDDLGEHRLRGLEGAVCVYRLPEEGEP